MPWAKLCFALLLCYVSCAKSWLVCVNVFWQNAETAVCAAWTSYFFQVFSETILYSIMLKWDNSWFSQISSFHDIPRFCGEGLPKMLDFNYFVLIWWQTDQKQEQSKLQGPVYLPIIWLIIGSDNIFYIEVNGKLAIHVIVHKSPTQNLNMRLKFWIYDSYMDISTYWWHRKKMPKSGNRPLI